VIGALEYIALHLRDRDRREVHGVRWDDDPIQLAHQTATILHEGRGHIVEHDGRPAAVIGVCEVHPGVWQGLAFGTDDFARCIPRLTKLARVDLQAYIVERGGHRLEVFSRFDHEDSHRWLVYLGAEREGVMRCYGKDGADFVRFAWTRGE
jgi:hypothetical protein